MQDISAAALAGGALAACGLGMLCGGRISKQVRTTLFPRSSAINGSGESWLGEEERERAGREGAVTAFAHTPHLNTRASDG